MSFRDKLISLNACEEAIEWAGDMPIEEIWATCERGDWMLSLASKLNINFRVLTAAKAECAAIALPYMKDPSSIAAIADARAYARGEITDQDLAAAYAPAAVAAASAAYAARAAAYAPAAVAAASAAYAAHSSAAEEKHETLKECANIVRNIITIDMIASQL